MILMAGGDRPATGFLKDTGIRMARNGALLVDREMQTSLPDVWAAGDCATCYHRVLEEDYYLPWARWPTSAAGSPGAIWPGGMKIHGRAGHRGHQGVCPGDGPHGAERAGSAAAGDSL